MVRINYGDIPAVGNPVDCFFAGTCQLGASNGPGFGWRNTTVYKFGVAYQLSPQLTLRGGFITLDQPIPSGQTFFNVLAPGVVENHLTLGATWTLANQSEVTLAYMHAFEKKVNGSGSIPGAFAGGEANLRMSQNSLGIGWGAQMGWLDIEVVREPDGRPTIVLHGKGGVAARTAGSGMASACCSCFAGSAPRTSP